MKPRRVAPLVLLVMVTAQSASATGSQTLRQLVSNSELVIVARAEGREQPAGTAASSDDRKSRLFVLEILKGTCANTILLDSEPENTPTGPFLAFLKRCADGEGYAAVGCVFDGKPLSDKELNACVTKVRALVGILNEKDTEVRGRETTEWLVGCVEEPCLRRDGLTDLLDGVSDALMIPRHEWLWRFFGRRKYAHKPFCDFLTDEHRNRLAVVLKSLDTNDDAQLRDAVLVTKVLTIDAKDAELLRLASRAEWYEFHFRYGDGTARSDVQSAVRGFVRRYDALCGANKR